MSAVAVPPRGRPLSWPDARRLRAYLFFVAGFWAFFGPAYFLPDLLTDPARRHGLYWQWETGIPFVPWTVWVYLSIYTAFSVPLVQMEPAEMRRLLRQLALSVAIGAACFLLVPGRLGFPPTAYDGPHALGYAAVLLVDRTSNTFPSLHVANCGLILMAARDVAVPRLRPLYPAWLGAIALSTLLAHQHHVIDVLGGLVLLALVRAAVPFAERRPVPSIPVVQR